MLAHPLSLTGETTYIIKKHDTLTQIAHQYGISVADLARANGISSKDTIYAGHRLLIPSKTGTRNRPVLKSSVRKAIARAHVRAGRWKYIVIHHSGTTSATVKGMDEYHRRVRHMENGLAYHFVIGNGHGMKDGAVAVGPRWTKQLDGGHLASPSLNKISLGICLVGNFDKQRPTAKQMASLEALIRALLARCHLGLDAIKTHQQINPVYTRCPGRHFPLKALLKDLRG